MNNREIFRARCFARAVLLANGWLGLHEAVDDLQDHAEACGLVAAIGQDAVQTMMALFFAPLDDAEHIIDGIAEPTIRAVANSTHDAVMYLIQQNDSERLYAFLERHTADERKEIKEYFDNKAKCDERRAEAAEPPNAA
jgi:hypothetical protein